MKIKKKYYNQLIDYIFKLQKRVKELNERVIVLEVNSSITKNMNKILEEIENDEDDGK